MKIMKATIIMGVLIMLFSCNNAEKQASHEDVDQTIREGSKKTNPSEKNVTDSVAKQMMEMFGMEGETFHDMMKTDSLESEINSVFSSAGLQKLLEDANLSDADTEALLFRIKQMENQNKGTAGGDVSKTGKEALDGYFKELQNVLANSGSEKQLKDLQAMMEKQNVQAQLDGLSTPKPVKTENLRKILGADDNTFIESDLSSYSLYGGNKEKREALMKLSTASKEEGETILMDYYQISKKELELLKSMPTRQHISSENAARKILEDGLPPAVGNHNSSGKASPKFKNMTEFYFQEHAGRANNFIKNSVGARAKFYKENPGWYGDKTDAGNTYVDSRNQYIFLPLGALSFADKVISHDVGSQGSNSGGAVNEPDFALERFDKRDPRICNLGTKGVLTLEFTNNTIADVNGPDLYIFEMGQIEPTNLEISKDGKTWINVGKIEGGTAKVDIAPYIKKGETYNYIRLTDLETWSELPGADVDAVAAIGGALRLNLDSAVLFDTGKFQLKETASSELKKLLDAIKTIPKARIVVEGHTDDVGNPASNKILSENRATEVSNYLKKHLSKEYRIEIKGFGESQPIAPNNTEKNREKNRRVEILVIPF
ncbi:OmpA family protein [Flavobacteriaceae bacterium MAR_2010_188]|nr:OmpA family protein [Flavobacteriaceae bacterium MAR_2010_188]